MTDKQNDLGNDAIGSDGIFLRAADRRRFEYLLRAIREESQSITLSSDNDGVLDHYGRLLLTKLRKTEGLQIEVFLPQNTEALLQRYNQILADISIDDARKTEGSTAPRRVLIAHDAKAIATRDLQLMSRLAQDFPGANVSLVLLIDRAGMQLHERTLEAFGQRLLRWPVDAPTRSEGEALLSLARGLGYEIEVKKVLAATGYAEIKIAPKAPKPAAADGAQSRFEQQLAAARKERDESTDPLTVTKVAAEARTDRAGRTEPSLDAAAPKPTLATPRKGKPSLITLALRWLLALVLLLGFSVALILALFPQKLSPLLANSPLLKDHLPQWAMEGLVAVVGKPPTVLLAEAEAQKPAPNPSAESNSTAATVPPPAVDTTKENTETKPSSAMAVPSLPMQNKGEPAKTESAKAEPAKAELAKVEPAKVEPAKVEPAKIEPAKTGLVKTEPVKAEPPKAELKPNMPAKTASLAEVLKPRSESGIDAAVRAAKAGSFFVQHASLSSMAEAQEWRAQFRGLAGAKIAAVNVQAQGVKFAVISGPFNNRAQAEDFAARVGLPADPWIRPLKSLLSALQPAER